MKVRLVSVIRVDDAYFECDGTPIAGPPAERPPDTEEVAALRAELRNMLNEMDSLRSTSRALKAEDALRGVLHAVRELKAERVTADQILETWSSS